MLRHKSFCVLSLTKKCQSLANCTRSDRDRDFCMELLKKAKQDGEEEDKVKSAETEVQKLTDQYIAKIDGQLTGKEKEILTV